MSAPTFRGRVQACLDNQPHGPHEWIALRGGLRWDCPGVAAVDGAADGSACPTCGPDTEVIGINVWGVYDGVLCWACQACGAAWPRFTEGRLGERSREYAAKWNQWGDEPEPEANRPSVATTR